MSPNKKANEDEIRTVAPSQKFEPNRLMDKKRATNVKCIDKYPSIMIIMSNVSAFLK
jgi:hypothetical protein